MHRMKLTLLLAATSLYAWPSGLGSRGGPVTVRPETMESILWYFILYVIQKYVYKKKKKKKKKN